MNGALPRWLLSRSSGEMGYRRITSARGRPWGDVMSPADFGKLIAGETEKWAKVIKFAGIAPE